MVDYPKVYHISVLVSVSNKRYTGFLILPTLKKLSRRKTIKWRIVISSYTLADQNSSKFNVMVALCNP